MFYVFSEEVRKQNSLTDYLRVFCIRVPIAIILIILVWLTNYANYFADQALEWWEDNIDSLKDIE